MIGYIIGAICNGLAWFGFKWWEKAYKKYVTDSDKDLSLKDIVNKYYADKNKKKGQAK